MFLKAIIEKNVYPPVHTFPVHIYIPVKLMTISISATARLYDGEPTSVPAKEQHVIVTVSVSAVSLGQ